MAKPSSIKLTYFDIEGRAEPVRLALALCGTEYEDERIQFADWQTLKPTTPYGKLPLLTLDGEEPKSQSGAMLRWVGSNCDDSGTLYPKSSLYNIEEAIGLVEDMIQSWAPCLYMGMRPQRFGYPVDYNKTDEGKELIKTMRETWIKEELPTWLKYIESMVQTNGDGVWIASKDAPTIADCVAVPTLGAFSRGYIDHVPADTLDKYPKIVEYIERFLALDNIKGRYSDGIH